MLPRTPRNLAVALLAMIAGCAPHMRGEVSTGTIAVAHSESSSQTTVQSAGDWRYHFGDDPRWADPNFDDSSWPIATQGRWPIPAFYSDGFIWVRVRIPVPGGVADPLAIRDNQNLGATDNGFVAADEVFVNGVRVGSRGSLPPRIELTIHGSDSIFDLPTGLAVPGKTSVVAFRAWYPPDVRWPGNFGRDLFTIDGIDGQAQSAFLSAKLVIATKTHRCSGSGGPSSDQP